MKALLRGLRILAADRDLGIAVVHDWCPNFRGGERVLARICGQFPNAEVFTLFDSGSSSLPA
ncbi:hypothetical protein [Sinorhizobium fredii]|uniref:hypothetical protein n=1 Tax=Rhizobium fredii TaxID=380 RepID=UPI001296D16A|nr:hypothetical protein [Sinorhizobium fredii]MQW96231.1 hypothetical protein [Sinorhizobium fredii]UTY46261.1 hypothetical protein EPK84_04940 [Sinorhizobium fredii]